MKALRLIGAEQIALEDIPVPKISENEVLLEVKYCGICGSDIHAYKMPEVFPAGSFLGHELAGVIVEIGSRIEDWRIGDRVTVNPLYHCGECYSCNHALWSCCPKAFETIGVTSDERLPGGFAKYVRIPHPEYQLYRLPENLSFEEGSLVEPLADGLHGIRISSFKPGNHTMVLGSGPIGLGVISFLKYAGAGKIIVTEVNAKRIDLAKRFGADYVINPRNSDSIRDQVLSNTNGLGVDQVFDCSGVPEAFCGSLDYLKPRGQIVLIGIIEPKVSISPYRFQPGEFQLIGSWCQDDEFPMVLDFLDKSESKMKELVSSIIPLSDVIEKGFLNLIRPDHSEIKVLVHP